MSPGKPAHPQAPAPPNRGFRFLYLIDAATLFGLMVVITAARFGSDWPTYPVSHYAAGFAVATLLHVISYYFGGLYEHEPRLSPPPLLPRATVLTFLAVGSTATVSFLNGRYLMPRGNLVILAVTASLLVSLNRRLARQWRSRRFGHCRVLLLGSAEDADSARRHLAESEPAVEIVGQFDPPVEPAGLAAAADRGGIPASESGDLIAEVERTEATDLLLLSSRALDMIYPQPLTMLEDRRVGVYQRIAPADTLLGLQRSRQIAGMPFVALRTHALPLCRLRFKRLLDLVYLLVLAPFAIVLLVAIALYVRLLSGPGVIYRQQRVGMQGRLFVMWKFRTMTIDAEKAGPELATADDPRIVAGLGWLRRTRLDELPQLWNVLVGEMSLVGPRAERPALVADLERQIAGYGRRHDIPPGITGLAQTQGHYQTDAAYKLGHDLQYVVTWSPLLDWEIMVKSLVVMARRSGR
ncbi:MAG: exopolysaccharide biosynthesis polyprenyl glycosylphosphotransferase [Acidimicrobiaceae bacterium]|nr:exopolysaccharide biosynthesis polyprenyl glycosylphosphotransferase [Acidimicrobiaceae bacterium]MCY4279445.1 exopolysaccharide biosynthesis polyprenyl glycosylphosphotransferase [Acidimicrobiaceae bacterium]MCY4293817.1 exopolysaccharide biosynthesis polyprenyl glycosylphosphotransferase [Acidimicrobiaceae bacterium]